MQNIGTTLISICFTFLYIKSSAQLPEVLHFNEKLVYELSYTKDSLVPEIKHYKHAVLIGDGISLTGGVGNIDIDTSMYQKRQKGYKRIADLPEGSSPRDYNNDYRIIKFKQDIITYAPLFTLMMAPVRYTEKIVDLKWDLKNDTLTIGDWLCKKAELSYGGRIWTAWYSTDISNIGEGPYKFKGLPGIIVDIYDKSKTWEFKLSVISGIDYDYPLVSLYGSSWKKEQIQEINRQDFFKLYKASQIMAFEFQQRYVKVTYFKKEDEDRDRSSLIKRAAKDNNWIELSP